MPQSSSLLASANKVVGAIRRRLFDRRIPGREIGRSLRIDDLICPLRYDVVVRANFIEALAADEGLLSANVEKTLEHPAGRAYETWFKDVFLQRFFPGIAGDETKTRQGFAKRVEQTRQLWLSVSANGIDPSQPISLRSGKHVSHVNGKRIGTSIFTGDGCHRMACMLVLGKEMLQPHEYQVVECKNYTPLDITAILIEALPLPMPDYLAFMARSYGPGKRFATSEQLLAHVQQNEPLRLQELQSVLAYDLPRLTPVTNTTNH